MEEGLSNYVPINRKFFNHAFWKEKRTFSKSEAWLYLIVETRFEESAASALMGGKLVKWGRGELPCSLRYLAEAWNWSKNKVDDYLNLLENEGMITKRTAEGTCQTIITLCNYDSYNIRNKRKGQQKGQSGDSEGTAGGQSRDKSNKDNKVKKEEDIAHGAPSIPPDEFEKGKLSFSRFEGWIKKHAPRVAEMKEPFTIEQYQAVSKRYDNDGDEIRRLLLCMHNWNDLQKKNRSAYLTLLNWKRRDEKK